MDDLVRWYSEQLDKDERIAHAAQQNGDVQDGRWFDDEDEEVIDDSAWRIAFTVDAGTRAHIAEHDPARVLREIDADRALVATYEQACRKRTEIAGEHWGATPSGDLSAVERWKEQDAVAEALKPHVLRRAAVYADRPGYREEWRP